jgi:hypothetical protein
MTTHYHVSQEELNSHPLMRLRSPGSLTIYEAALKQGRLFLCSTSGWSEYHLEALKVLDFGNQSVERLCPAQFIVSRESPLGSQVLDNFSLSVDDVKAGRYNMMSVTNWFYDELATLLRTSSQTSSPPVQNARPRRVIAPSTGPSPPQYEPGTILSMSFSSTSDTSFSPARSSVQSDSIQENVDVREIVTNNLIVSFLSLLSNIAYPERNPTKPRPSFNMLPDRIKFSLFGTSLTSVNDGSGWKTRFSQSGRQWVSTGGAPLITIEVQFLNALMDRQTGIDTILRLLKSLGKKLVNFWRHFR